MTPRASVVIPNYNGRAWLGGCLASIEAAGGPATEIIVVDNASDDGSVAWLRERGVTTIALAQNRGYAAACNAGIAAAAGDIVILLNNDVAVRPGWSAELVDCLDRDSELVIVGGLTLYESEPDTVNTAGIDVAPSLAGIDGSMGRPAAEAPAERDVAGVSGVSLAARRDWLLETGGLDELFFLYYEDLELCLRAWIEGHRVRYVPGSVVLHAGGRSSGARDGPARHELTTRNRMLMAAKLLGPRAAAGAWLWSLLSDGAVVAVHLFRGRPGLAWRLAGAKARGALGAVRALPQVRERRRRLAGRRVRDLRDCGLVEGPAASLRRFSALRGSDGPLR